MKRLVLVAVLSLGGVAAAQVPQEPGDHLRCLNCHSAHTPSYPGLLAALCEACHVAGGPATAVETHSSRTSDNGYGNWDLDCWSCHEPHRQDQNRAYGTTYGKLLRVTLNAEVKEIDPADPGPYWEALSIFRTVTSNSIRHTSNTTFVDGDAASNEDICQVCHVSTVHYAPATSLNTHADYGADSQPGGTCTSCHPHSSGFSNP